MTPEEIVERAAAVLDGHWNWNFPGGVPTCMGCDAPLDVHDWTPGMDVHPAMHRHQAAVLAASGLLPTEVEWRVKQDTFLSPPMPVEEAARAEMEDWAHCAAFARKHGNEDRAREWDKLAAELSTAVHVGCGGQWVSMAVVCGVDTPQVCARCGARRVVATALGAPPDGGPFTGAEVDGLLTAAGRAPVRTALVEDPEIAAMHEPGIDLTDAEFEDYRAGAGLPPTPGAEPQGPPVDGREVDRAPECEHAWMWARSVHKNGRQDRFCAKCGADFWDMYPLTPQTDGGADAIPPSSASPSPHATKES